MKQHCLRNKRGGFVPAILLFISLLGGCSGGSQSTIAKPYAYTPGPIEPFVSLEQVQQDWAKTEAKELPPPVTVKGIYLTSGTAANQARLSELLSLVERTELNAMVVNVKTDWGSVTYNSENPIAVGSGAVQPDLKDIHAFTSLLRSKHVYSIARVVTFKDAFVPKFRTDLAVHSTKGGIWTDYNGVPWLNPYNQEAWNYIVDVAKGAAMGGFDEIQFDYVRMPTDGDLDTIVYPGKDGRKREQVIADFLAYARKELRPYGVRVSADVFGLVTSITDDMGIGQRLEEIGNSVDYISPMVYPSHYIKGNLGLPDPNSMPYETVYRAMEDAKARLAAVGETDQVIMRPWLQDFSWGYPYGAKEVRAQIQATYDAGYKEWLLWNAANEYTEAALQPESKN